jgi:hypothetical protein
MSALALAKKATGRPGTAGSGSPIAAVQPAKAKPVQGPVRVRPWPAGPLPSEHSDDKSEKGVAKPKDKINRQIGLGPLLAELKIKGQRLHNAGEGWDSRFCGAAGSCAAGSRELLPDNTNKQQVRASGAGAGAPPVLYVNALGDNHRSWPACCKVPNFLPFWCMPPPPAPCPRPFA